MENLLRFLDKDHSFFSPWSAPPVTAEDKNKKLQEEEEEEEVSPGPDQTREEEDHPSTPFSLFSRQFDNCEKSRDDEEEEDEEDEDDDDEGKDDKDEDDEEEILLEPGVLAKRIHSNWIASGLLA